MIGDFKTILFTIYKIEARLLRDNSFFGKMVLFKHIFIYLKESILHYCNFFTLFLYISLGN